MSTNQFPADIVALNDASGYPFKDSRKVLRVNSSGICNLDCPYCFTGQSKKNTAMTRQETDFLFEILGENILFIFTGVGDFFAGYQNKDRFLEHILSRNAEVFLDANGVLLHEFDELSKESINKIRFFDVSYHYSTMKNKQLLGKWAENMETVAKKMSSSRYMIKSIFAYAEMEKWKEMLDFHLTHVYVKTGKKLTIVLDEFDTRMQNPIVLKVVNTLVKLYAESVHVREYAPTAKKGQTHFQMATSLSDKEPCLCPAGSRYFKIDVDGNILPCDLTGGFLSEKKVVLGNTKLRRLRYINTPHRCSQVQGPCCIKYWDDAYPPLASANTTALDQG